MASVLAREHPANHQNYTAVLFGLRDFVGRDIRPILLLLFAAAGLLLLITCGNVAGLLLTRSVGRARETAIRIALGGGRKELASQFFFEGLLVSLPAAALGVGVSGLLVRMIVALARDYIPRADEISTNWMVAVFAALAACGAAMLSAMAPLWHAVRTHPNDVLTDGARSSAGNRSRKLSRSLVVSEIALAFTLLCASALLLTEIQKLSSADPGFETANLLTFQLNVVAHFGSEKEFPAFQERVLRAIGSVPGVSDVALANQVPLEGCCLSTALFTQDLIDRQDIDSSVSFVTASTDYFRTLRIPLIRGRLLTPQDTNEHLIPVLIDEAAARRFWPNANPVGAVAHLGNPNGSACQVVGVVGDVRNEGLNKASRPEVFILSSVSPPDPMQVFVRSNLPPSSLVPALRHAVKMLDPTQPIYGLQTMTRVKTGSLTIERLASLIVGFFAFSALLMASLGVFGVTAYSVRQRRVEIGTRMALGAGSRDLIRLVVGSGMSMAVYGLAVGIVAVALCSAAVIRYFSIHELSALPYVSSIAVIAAMAMCASFIPAWQATLLSPMLAIRDQSDSLWAITRRSVGQALKLSGDNERITGVDATSITDFMVASRLADSFAEVLRIALDTVREKVNAETVMLLQKDQGGEFFSGPDGLSIPSDGFLANRLQSYAAPLAFSPADLTSLRGWAAEQKPHFIPEIAALQNAGVRLAAALKLNDELTGLLFAGAPIGREQYSAHDKKLFRSYAGQFALMLENARLTDRVVEQETFRRDVALAAEVQQRLLPQISPQTETSSLDAFSLPVRIVGGDYYDFLDVGPHRIGIALADVAGKGIAAALIMAVIHASLRIIAAEKNISLPELAARMNAFLHRSTGASSYATFFYAQVDENSMQLRYVNAGHNPPYLVRTLAMPRATCEGAPIEELAIGGMIIGMFPSAGYEEAVVDLKPGDVLLVFTDGVTEALNVAGEEFGEERLQALIRRVAHLAVAEIKASISHELRAWIGAAPQHDDLTFVVMKVR